MSDKLFGKLPSEEKAAQNDVCRRIVRDIVYHENLSQRQLIMIIYLLGIELEDVSMMRSLTSHVKDIASDIFVSDEGDDDGT